MSDVPVGVFTSGGLDSSILATLAAKFIGVDKVHTYSAAFAEQSYDESPVAEELAKRIRTRYVPVPTDAGTLLEALQCVVRGVAEPLADPAILPTFLLARAARQHVKVVLSGEGADELFGGYPTYIGHKLAPMYDAMPSFVRAALRRRAARAVIDEEGDAGVSSQTLCLRRREAVDRAPPGVVRHRPVAGRLPASSRLAGASRRSSDRRSAGGSDAARLSQLPPRQPAGESRPGHDALVGRGARAVPRPRRHPLSRSRSRPSCASAASRRNGC